MSANSGVERKRILVLTSTFPRWKGDREPPFVFELSRRMKEEFEVVVLAPHAPQAKLAETIDGVTVYRFQYFFKRWQTLAYGGGILANLKRNRLNYLLIPFFIFFEFLSMVRILRSTRIDVVHAHWIIPQALVALAARAFSTAKPAIVCTSHGGDLFGLSGFLLSKLKRKIIRRIDKLTVVSHAMRDYAVSLAGRSDVQVIPMGVELDNRFTPIHETSRNPHEILFVGRLVEKKGVRYLILAMAQIIESHPQAILLVAGDGPEKANLQQLAVSTGVENHIRFLGPIDNAALADLYRRAAIFVGPSVVATGGDQEGLGLVFVEALGCECAVVASDLPAIRDIVLDGVTGIVCQQKNSADLAVKVQFLLEHREVRESLGRAGREHVLKHFDWRAVSQRYQQLIGASTRGRQ